MKKLISAALISLFVVFAISANAGSFEDAVAAYERKDYVTAAKLMRVAADQGNAQAQYNLGVMYANGQEMKIMKKLISLALISMFIVFAVSANAGPFEDGVAAYERKEYVTAVKLFRVGADQGDADAQFNLGFMYEAGQGVSQDYIRAHMWWNISASSSHKNAEANCDIIAKQMSPTQIEKAQEMARRCQSSNFKNCD